MTEEIEVPRRRKKSISSFNVIQTTVEQTMKKEDKAYGTKQEKKKQILKDLIKHLLEQHRNEVLSTENEIKEIPDGYSLSIKYNEGVATIEILKKINDFLLSKGINERMKCITQTSDQTSKRQIDTVVLFFDKVEETQQSGRGFYYFMIIIIALIIYECILYCLQILNENMNFSALSMVHWLRLLIKYFIHLSKDLQL